MCWRGYLSGGRCKRFAYGQADATAAPSSCFIKTQKGFIFLVLAYPGGPEKEAVIRVSVYTGQPVLADT